LRISNLSPVSLDFTKGIRWYLAFVFSTTAHEAAHAWTALKLGDDTAHRGGQATLGRTDFHGIFSGLIPEHFLFAQSAAVNLLYPEPNHQ